MTLLHFGASNHSASINATLARWAAQRFQARFQTGTSLEEIDLNDFEMPIYSLDREREGGVPSQAQDFRARIAAADALIISFAEYNGTYTSAWKNIYDWMSRLDGKVYADKPTLALAATPGPRAGAGVLASVEGSAPFFGMDLKGVVGIGSWGEAFDNDRLELTRAEDIDRIDAGLAALNAAMTGQPPPVMRTR